MGQGGSKPPIRKVIPFEGDDSYNEDTEEETGENSVDMLGISAEENDYPEPKPPDRDVTKHHAQSELGTIREIQDIEDAATIIPKAQDRELVSARSRSVLEYPLELVPVGASFQNGAQKNADIKNFETPLSTSRTTWDSYPVVKTLARSLSLRETLLGSSHITSSGMLSGVSQREAMLAERERHEYLKLIAPSTESVAHRGQVRRYNYDGTPRDVRSATATDKFKNVEDRLADEIAEKHREHRAETYASLLKDLTMNVNSERLKVKIILAWMSKQGIGRLQFEGKPPSPETPNGYMMLIQAGQGTFPVFFALLCRAASLKCAIIHGISKGSHYEVGSQDIENLKNTWNAVYVEGSWQLVHPLWVCKGVANRQLGGWLKIEEEGKSQRKLSVASFGKDVPSFNPYFIFTKPEEFIYRNFPDEERWQLLPNPKTLEEFLNLTYIRPIFFQNKFKLQSDDECVLESESGEPCEIKISFPKQKAFDAVFGYELSKKIDEEDEINEVEEFANGDQEGDDDKTIEHSNNVTETERYVMVKKSEGYVTFEVRFISRGIYKLRLYGGYFREFGNKPPWILDVVLKCDELIPQALPLPFDPGSVGWGPGPMTENYGLYVPSHVESEVSVTDEEDTIIYFILHEKQNIRCELHHSSRECSELEEFVETCIVLLGDILTLQIRVMFPGIGEYGLRIYLLNSQQIDVNVCNYIVQTSEKRPFESFHPRRARRMILNAMETCDLDFLKAALDECEKTGLSDSDPDVMGGRNRHEYLSCKTELYVALLVNRIDVSEHALHRTRKANLDILLAKEMTQVEEHLQKLLKLDEGGWSCDIPEIDRKSLVELSQLRKPKIEVRLVITAMYMLLGIDEEKLKDWGKVRKFLRNQQSTLIEIARLEKYLMLGTTSDVTVSESVLNRVEEILCNYTQDAIRRVDNTAAAYFQWVTTVSDKLKENIRKYEEEKAKSAKANASSKSTTRKPVKQKTEKDDDQISRTLSISSKASTMSGSRSLFSRTPRAESEESIETRSFKSKSIKSVSRSTNLKTISEENNANSTSKSEDQGSQKPVSSRKATTAVSRSQKEIKMSSTTPSSKEQPTNVREAQSSKSRLSVDTKSSVRSPSVRNNSGPHSRISRLSNTVQNGTAGGNKAVNGMSPSPVKNGSPEKSKTSLKESKKSLNSTPVSRKPSIVSQKSKKTEQLTSKQNSVVKSNLVDVEETNGDPIYSFRNEEITGKTFFSESSRSQKDGGSRPVSIKSRRSVKAKKTK